MGGSVGLIIGSFDGGSGDVFFEWVCSSGFQIDWVSNRLREFLIGGLGGGCGGRC